MSADLTYKEAARDTREKFVRSVLKAARAGVLRKLTFSSPLCDTAAPRLTARVTTVRSRAVLSFEEDMPDKKVRHFHIPLDDDTNALIRITENYAHVNAAASTGQAEMMASKNGKVTLRGISALSVDEAAACQTTLLPYNRQINYIFDGTATFLQHLGISDKNGRVYDKKQAKFRQINRFLEYAEDIYDHLPSQGTLSVYDLCCGKSYLSFALYAYLHEKKNREVDMLCVDLKEDVIAFCSRTAQELGYTGMRFLVSDIRLLPRDHRPDLVVSLHACDVATDVVLDTASQMQAAVILSTPCCHHYLSRRLDCDHLSFVTGHPYLKTRLSETLTDALRLMMLESRGYRVDAAELIDVADTPRNTLLRAVRMTVQNEVAKEKARTAYRETLAFLLGEKAETYLKDL